LNAQQILQWIKDNRPDWVDSDKYKWLQWALQSSPQKQAVLDSVNRDIQNGEVDIQKVNTNAEYNVQQATKPQSGSNVAESIARANPLGGGLLGQQQQPHQVPQSSGSTWTSVQQMQDYINTGGSQNFLSKLVGGYPTGSDPKKPKTDAKYLTNYVNGLPKSEQKTALASIQQFLKDRSGGTPLQQKDLDDARNQAVRDVQQTTGKPATQVPASGQDPSQNLFTVSPDSTTPSSGQIAMWERLTGQNFDQSYQSFVNSQYVSVQQQATQGTSTVLTGNEMLWSNGKYEPLSTTSQQGYSWVFTAHPKSEALTPQEQQQAKGKNLQVSKSQFLGMMMASNANATSKMGLVQAVENAITAQTNIPLTDAEKSQIYDKIAPMSLADLSKDTTTQGGGVQGWAANAIKPTGILGSFMASLPEVSQNVAMQNAITTLQKGLGSNYAQYVTPDQITALSKMSDADQTNYINNLPDPTHPGFTVGAWTTGYGQILNNWQQNFGYSSKPTDSQITALMGMNITQQTDYFNNSPSPVAGMNNESYKKYDTTINSLRDDLTPSMGADFMASLAKPSKTPVP
jgi:hypothetical protein